MPRTVRSRTPVAGAPHGTRAGYKVFQCGCPSCVEWNRLEKIQMNGTPSRAVLIRVHKLRRLDAQRAAIAAEITELLAAEAPVYPSTRRAALEVLG